jgi:hypothetical protein
MWKIFSVPCGSALYRFHCICKLIKEQRYFSEAKSGDWRFYQLLLWFCSINRMSLRSVLLWITLDLALIIQCLSWNNSFFFFFFNFTYHIICFRVPPGARVPQVEHHWPIVPAPDDGWWVWSGRWNKWQGKRKYSEKTWPSATLFDTNQTRSDL